MIQPYAARRLGRRQKVEHITIQGGLVFRLFSANAMPENTSYGTCFLLDC